MTYAGSNSSHRDLFNDISTTTTIATLVAPELEITVLGRGMDTPFFGTHLFNLNDHLTSSTDVELGMVPRPRLRLI